MADKSIPKPEASDSISTEDKAEEAPAKKMSISVKFGKQTEVFEIDETVVVRTLKELVSKRFNTEPNHVTLISAGKILKDNDTLTEHNIKDGLAIHLVIREAPTPASTSTRPPGDSYQLFEGFVGLTAVGINPGNWVDLQQRLQRELQNNSALLQMYLNHPWTQALINNPEHMRALLTSNPQMQELLEHNPETNNILNNPDLLRQAMEHARNAAVNQEMPRTQDRTIAPIPIPIFVPAGYNTFQGMYPGIQEPMLSSLSEQSAQNPFSGLVDQQTMANVLQQMLGNTDLMENMMSSPYTQYLLEALAADPTVTNALLSENPLFVENPALQEQIQAIMPHFVQQLESPTMENVLTDPETSNAVTHIQQELELETLRGTDSNLLNPANRTPAPTESATSTTSPSEEAPGPALAHRSNIAEMIARMIAELDETDTNFPPEQR